MFAMSRPSGTGCPDAGSTMLQVIGSDTLAGDPDVSWMKPLVGGLEGRAFVLHRAKLISEDGV